MKLLVFLTVAAFVELGQAFLAASTAIRHSSIKYLRENNMDISLFVSSGTPAKSICFKRRFSPWLFMASEKNEEQSPPTIEPLSKAESILDEFHRSDLPFRIVVIGNGAILETTTKLGPKSSSSVSPKTGDKLLTFASDDASFEFHVKVEQVCMVTFVATERSDPKTGETKTMRVSRFLTEKGTPICSLILADSSSDAVEWFNDMTSRYGHEVIM